jgi:hypothetical protein
MPTKTERPKANISPTIARAIAVLRDGKPGVDPAEADWSLPFDPDNVVPSFGYYNYRLGRHEYGRGRIPQERLWEYDPTARQVDATEETPPWAP